MEKYQTKQRQKLIALFEARVHQALTPRAIHDLLEGEGISLSAIYRNLALMEQDGLLHKEGSAYRYVSPNECKDIIHLKCEACECTLHLNKSISRMLLDLAREEFQFHLNSSTAFLYGKCANCSQKISL